MPLAFVVNYCYVMYIGLLLGLRTALGIIIIT